MRILITNASLGLMGGTQAYVRDLAAWLLADGHSPVVYGPDLGATAAQLGQLTVPVTDDLSTISVGPDIIHGNSTFETMAALLHFPDTPAIFVCHGWRGSIATAPRFPRVLRYAAVDDTCADRLLLQEGIPADRLSVVLNAVDLRRFRVRPTPLPPRPRRALVFGNSAHAMNHLSVIERACRQAGIEVDVIGLLAGTFTDRPEEVLGHYDLVFARAKCALEGMASGAAVILCDNNGLGGMVTAANVARLRRLNFGIRSLVEPLTLETISREIDAYDPADAQKVSEEIRNTASNDVLHQEMFALYESVIEEYAAMTNRADWHEESRAVAALMQHLATANRASEWNRNVVIQAAHRILRTPLVGPLLLRSARWIVDRGKRSK
jgi:hypothetical protein